MAEKQSAKQQNARWQAGVELQLLRLLNPRVTLEVCRCKRIFVSQMTLAAISQVVTTTAKAILSILDWLVAVAERLVALIIGVTVFYASWSIFHGTADPSLKDSLKTFSDNWRVFLLLLIPLFYRTVRIFLERVRKFAGMETELLEKEKHEVDQGRGE